MSNSLSLYRQVSKKSRHFLRKFQRYYSEETSSVHTFTLNPYEKVELAAMFTIYLKRELTRRARQTLVIASGLGVAVALVITINSVSGGIQQSQETALANLYGVGTDLTVTKPPQEGQGFGQRFAFGLGTQNQNSTQSLSNTRLIVSRGQQVINQSDYSKIVSVKGIKAATGTLRLNNITFSGTLPNLTLPNQSGSTQNNQNQSNGGALSDNSNQNRGDGLRSGGNFNVDQFSVEGIDSTQQSVGPITSTKVIDGRLLTASDKNQPVALVDQTYATSNSLKVGSTIKIKDAPFAIVGLVAPQSSSTQTESNIYIPIDQAQTLSGNSGITTIYIQASDNSQVASLKSSLSNLLPGISVNSSADLAANISGSLQTASSLINGLGGWLSILVLLGAFLISILFTLSGVNRRTREFGTLKALGWKNSRISRQILGESLVSGFFGGILGIGLGMIGVAAINIWGPSLNASISRFGNFGRNFGQRAAGFQGGPGGGGFQGGGQGSGRNGFGQAFQNVSTFTLHASPSLMILAIGIVFSLAGGVIAGLVAGRRIVRLSPAEAMRSVA